MFKDNYLKAVMSGIYLTFAAVIYLLVLNTLNNKIMASLLFSFALLLIVARDYNLYTGKVGYLIPYNYKNFINIVITLLGNISGILLIGSLFLIINNNDINNFASSQVTIKFNNLWHETLVLSILCGMMMYTAVDGYKHIKDLIIKVLIVIFSVMFFLLAGFEHSIANIIYVLLSKTISFKILLYLLIMIIGNGIGAVLLNYIHLNIKRVFEKSWGLK